MDVPKQTIRLGHRAKRENNTTTTDDARRRPLVVLCMGLDSHTKPMKREGDKSREKESRSLVGESSADRVHHQCAVLYAAAALVDFFPNKKKKNKDIPCLVMMDSSDGGDTRHNNFSRRRPN